MSTFLDTNIFMRVLTLDDPPRAAASVALLKLVEAGEFEAWTTPVVVAELVWTLTGPRYSLGRAAVRDRVLPITQLRGLHVGERSVWPRAFEVFVRYPIDLIDAYHAVLIESRGETELVSFDRDFDRVPGLRRREP
jgi:predicted nucleic acid-binding protein